MEAALKRRVVAIVGRPNVGKSALFNRIIGRRMAIVHEQSGVTRDRLCAEAQWYDQRFELIDTGGIDLIDNEKAADSIDAGTRSQVDLAMQAASALIFVVDVTAGVTALDEEVARILHQSGLPIILAVNKCDNRQLDDQHIEFLSLGFPTFPISVLHGRGLDDMVDEAVKHLPPAQEEDEQPLPLRIAVVGRPNAGKSSYINALMNDNRVIVSDIAGTTVDSIEVPFAIREEDKTYHYTLIDTAGIRRFGKARSVVEKFSLCRAETSIKYADVVVMMMDAEEGPTKQNKKIAMLVDKYHKGCIICINKWDLVEGRTTEAEYRKALYRELHFLDWVEIVFVSAKTGFNIRKTITAIDHVGEQICTQLSTGVLNRVIQDAYQKLLPPVVGNHRLKFYYATQVGTKPVKIRFFVNNPERLTPQYEHYLQKRFREAFGMRGAPMVFEFVTRNDRLSRKQV